MKIEIINNFLYHIEPVPKSGQNEEKNIGVIKDITEFITDDYKKHTELLVREGIVDIISGEDKSEDELWNTIDKTTNEILTSKVAILFKETEVKMQQTLLFLQVPSRNRLLMMLGVSPEEMRISEVIRLTHRNAPKAAWEVKFKVDTLQGLKNALSHFNKSGLPFEFDLEY